MGKNILGKRKIIYAKYAKFYFLLRYRSIGISRNTREAKLSTCNTVFINVD